MEPGAVDVGFAQDMIVHHNQGVLMAHYAELDTDDSDIAVLAYDINYTQTAQIGQMQGWLALWGKPVFNSGTVMGWMTAGGMDHMNMGDSTSGGTAGMSVDPARAEDGAIMPGMATNTEMAKLKSLRGKESDIYFLQLMIRHHQGGADMMEYAAANASVGVVRNFAGQMLQAQQAEIGQMTDWLADLGAQPLPAP
ncbi:DUF305 domain-containing protein [Nakamurella sp. YIM 132087]|uniref:DUF305 domain-containing protein n=2 Tax=Nakamurella alba TaxID=2665158 RepID=A0A7K1FHS7_9ACTN|nr:DUF305 domain-containing protein [Nakamurella alba]